MDESPHRISQAALFKLAEQAFLQAARAAFGPDRELEAQYNEELRRVDLFVYLTVVEEVTQPTREVALAELRRRNLEANLGEELGFQIFWHPDDAAHARQQDALAGDLLGLGEARATFGRIAIKAAKQALLDGVEEHNRAR